MIDEMLRNVNISLLCESCAFIRSEIPADMRNLLLTDEIALPVMGCCSNCEQKGELITQEMSYTDVELLNPIGRSTRLLFRAFEADRVSSI